ncbi:winged helix-turn-helix domain-containing protein [Shewanella livingstonensis]|uniref:Winged helix-turn-helix domain-containing protein n=1 Tax=Shewanella livingstonensis TaxID=150120 RepID=A0A3G8LQD3_9GAMM|nr:crosslink repair DNA glycosylase YcaQ family protein [Shewanella livingstonensis]AZG71739.1 winged helix-turn-helix domain-containing protein [Shewanella livingstonensis]
MTNPYSATQWLQLSMQQQGLLQPLGSLSELMQQLSYVQIDSINVVERAHHHVLHNRLADYSPAMLDEAMTDKTVFEYWSHAAAYLPIDDYRFSLYRKQQLQQGDKHWFEPEHKVMREVKARITAEGPLKASQFTHNADAKKGSWWDWKPAKKALEQLFIQGELMVAKRDKFQKVYDLTERVLPRNIDITIPSDTEYAQHLINRYLAAHGFGNLQQIQYLRKGLKPLLSKTLAQMCEQGEIAHFTGANAATSQVYFYQPKLTLPTSIPNKVWLLNPFDNLVIQRQKLKQWFGFDYQIEVYVPEAKRQYGYYSLPILWRDRFVGRVDVKADRKNQCLLLQNLHIETQILTNQHDEPHDKAHLVSALIEAIEHYTQFNNCQRWQLLQCNDKTIAQMLLKASQQSS